MVVCISAADYMVVGFKLSVCFHAVASILSLH